MKVANILLPIFFLFCLSNSVPAQTKTSSQPIVVTQDYKNGLGVRFGGMTSGITFKHFGKPLGAFEGILSWGYRTFLITGLYEQHINIGSAPGLRWFYGGGAHVGFFRYDGYYYWAHKNG